MFDERYQTFWMDKEVVESHQILRLHGGVEDLLSFKEFVLEEVPVLFVSATIAISKKVHLPALLGYQEQQIYRVPITVKQHQELLVPIDFPDVVSLSSVEYAGAICQLIDGLLPLRKPIFLLFTSKELLLETSNALKFLIWPSIEMAMQLILSDDLTEEKAIFYWEQEASGRESIFPNKKK